MDLQREAVCDRNKTVGNGDVLVPRTAIVVRPSENAVVFRIKIKEVRYPFTPRVSDKLDSAVEGSSVIPFSLVEGRYDAAVHKNLADMMVEATF